MGIGGHILGERKLRQLQRKTGVPFDRAYRRNHYCEARLVNGSVCVHFTVDWQTGEVWEITQPIHWTSCPRSCDS